MSIFNALLHLIGTPILMYKWGKLAKKLDDPVIAAQIADVQKNVNNLVDSLRNLCKRNPTHKHCDPKRQEIMFGKSRYQRVKHRLK